MVRKDSNDYMNDWPEIKISDWKDFASALEPLKLEKDWLSHWAFRGQTDSNWTLKPSILRLLERHGIGRQMGIRFERTIYREFFSKAHLFEDFKFREFKEGNALVTFSLMQHYGSPTRLLDWTESPYIALYFAVNSDFSKDGAVYLFNQTLLNDLNNEDRYNNEEILLNEVEDSSYLKTIITNFQTRRSNSQQGIYSLAANIDKDHADLIQNIFREQNTDEKLYALKLVIDKDAKLEFLARLRKINLRADQLFPDLYGFSTSLKDLLEIRGWEKKV